MKNIVKDGNTLQVTAPSGGLVSGKPHPLRTGATGQVVIPITSGDEGDLVECDCAGRVHEYTAETGVAWAQGDLIYWDATNDRYTKTSTANTYAGAAAEAKASAAAVGRVQLKRLGA